MKSSLANDLMMRIKTAMIPNRLITALYYIVEKNIEKMKYP